MDSVVNLLAISLFIVIVYSWSSNFHHKHKHHKKLYLLYKSKYNKQNNKIDDSEGFVVGGQENEDPCSNENNPCKNSSKCIRGKNIVDGVEYDYSCECISSSGVDSDGIPYSGRSYSGYNCQFVNDELPGVGVKLLDNLDEIVMPIVYEKEAMFERGTNEWNDYL